MPSRLIATAPAALAALTPTLALAALGAGIAAPAWALPIGVAAAATASLDGLRRLARARAARAAVAPRDVEAEIAAAVAAARTEAEAQAAAAREAVAAETSAALGKLADRLAAGDLTARLGAANGLDAEVRLRLDAALGSVNAAVDEALALADVASNGDLSARASGAYAGHAKALTAALNGLLDGLAGIVGALAETVHDNGARAVELKQTAGALVGEGERQSAAIAALDAGMTAIGQGLGVAASVSAEGRAAVARAVAAADQGRARVDETQAAMAAIRAAAGEIATVLGMIESISQQTTLLAVNAGVEAARAGQAGRGFAIVTQEIGRLAAGTSSAARKIDEIVKTTAAQIDIGSRTVRACGGAIDAIVASIAEADERAARVVEACETQARRAADCAGDLAATKSATAANARLAETMDRMADAIRAGAEDLERVVSGFRLDDRRMAEEVTRRAARISAAFEAAVDRGEITLDALFSREATPIPGTNPQQFTTPFLALTDRLLPPVLESVFELGEGVAFSAAVNLDGFLPTHNRKFSQPQGADATWNAANCRNRRFFDDRVGLGAGRSRAPHFLQVYRRDMGGGNFVTMKDISAPIMVKGRHWGGLRIGYRSQPAAADAGARPATSARGAAAQRR